MTKDAARKLDRTAASTTREYTVVELERLSGVPLRTLRFYRAEGVLDAPVKRGRVNYYGPHHLERLEEIARLQERGLNLKMMRELFGERSTAQRSVADWLGFSGTAMLGPADDTSRTYTSAEMADVWGKASASARKVLMERGLVEKLATRPVSYRVEHPAQLALTLRCLAFGLTVEGVFALGEVFRTHLREASRHLVRELFSGGNKHFATDVHDASVAQDYLAGLHAIAREGLPLLFLEELQAALEERFATPT